MPTSPLFAIPMLEGGSDYPTPDATADAKQINDQFKYIEQFLGVQEATSTTLPPSPKTQEFVYETDTGRLRYWSGVSWVTVAYRTTGTTAERDALYPTPSTAAARVALAATAPRWFNTEKGYEQQYFAQFDDAGAGVFSKETHGWFPAAHLGLVPITTFTVSNTNGTATKKGPFVEVAACQAVKVQGCFSADFREYKVEVSVSTASAAHDILFGFVNGSTPLSVAAWQGNRIDSGGGVLAQSSTNAVNTFTTIVGRMSGSGGHADITVHVPQGTSGEGRRGVHSRSSDNDGYQRLAGTYLNGVLSPASVPDGFEIVVTADSFTGRVRVFGVNG